MFHSHVYGCLYYLCVFLFVCVYVCVGRWEGVVMLYVYILFTHLQGENYMGVQKLCNSYNASQGLVLQDST